MSLFSVGRWVSLVCLAGACGACSAAGDSAVYSDGPVPSPAAGTQLAASEPEPCGVAFDPAPELLEATQRAAERWSAATGCDVRVDADGIPLVVLDEVIDNAGKPTRGRTTTVWVDGVLRTDRIEYRRDSLDQVGRIVPHEMGHAIGGYGHSGAGIMRERPKATDVIDSSSLELVCATLDCAAFEPEL